MLSPEFQGPNIDISALSGSPDAASPFATMWQEKGFIGPYQLVQPIGAGGMGEVWLAEQTHPVRRRVALKLIKAGMDTGEVMQRFQSERQALALMNHPAIAKVFDAGSTPQGRPYFAMEYIPGIPITTYCARHRLNVRERLELFVQVCDGVQHAHQKAILHRDLKPSNILVTEVDGKPRARIIDFGVAKAMEQPLTAETMHTQVGAVVGTPAYMSPEQAGSSGADVDTRTDVYSLGVVLYELLVGERPLDFQGLTFEGVLRRLLDDEPPRPSAKVPELRGDLDAITLKALEKDRAQRYGSPAELAADIERYLHLEPVLAVAPTGLYRARKFARRYRVALATTAAFVLVLIAAAAISVRQSIVAMRQRDRADREAAVAQAVNDFLQNDLLAQASAVNQSSPGNKPDPHMEVRTALDRAAARIGSKFGKQPEVEAAIRDTIGVTYADLGLYPEAREEFLRALYLHRRTQGAESLATLQTLGHLGNALYREGKLTESENLLGQAVAISRRVLGPENPDTLSSMNNLGNVYMVQGKYAEGEHINRQILETRRRVLGPEHPDTLESMNNLATMIDAQGQYSQAEALFRQVLEVKRRVLGPEHPSTLTTMDNLALVYFEQAKYDQAEALYNRLLDIQRRIFGSEHPEQTLLTMNNLASVLLAQGKYAKAAALYGQSLIVERRLFGAEHPDTLGYATNLANVYAAQGNYGEAEPLFNQTLKISRRVLGPVHPITLEALVDLASMYGRQGKYSLAETYAAQALSGRRESLGPEHPDTLASAADLALIYESQGKFAQAETLARETADICQRKLPDDWQRFRAESLVGASLAGQEKYAEAEPLLVEGYQGMLARKDRIAMPDRYHLDLAHRWLVQLYQAWGKPDKAAEWRKK